MKHNRSLGSVVASCRSGIGPAGEKAGGRGGAIEDLQGKGGRLITSGKIIS